MSYFGSRCRYTSITKEKSEILVNAFNPGLMKTHLVEGQNAKFYDFVRINMPERYGDLDMSSSALAELVYSEDIVLSII